MTLGKSHENLLDYMSPETLSRWEAGFLSVVSIPAYFLDLRYHCLSHGDQSEAVKVEEYEHLLPIQNQMGVLGYLALSRDGVMAFDEAQVTRARRLQHFMAQSISLFCQQEEQLELRIRQMSTLFELSALLSDQSDIDQMLSRSLQAMSDVLDIDAGSVRLISSDGQHLDPRAMLDLAAEYLNSDPIDIADSGIVSEAVRTRDVAVSSDMASDPRVQNDKVPGNEFCSMLVAPILNGRELIGAMHLYSVMPRSFDDYEKRLALSVGQVIGAAIANARQRERELQRYREMAALNRLSRLLTRRGDLPSLLNIVTEEAARVFYTKASSIRLLDDMGRLEPKAVYGLSAQFLEKGHIYVEKSAIDRSAMAGEVIYIENMKNDSRILYPEDARREGIVSVLAAGMVYNGRPIGVMRIYSDEVRRFTENEKNLLQSMAQLAAGAIENARLNVIRQEARRVQHQVALAAEVQQRLMPEKAPAVKPFDVAGRYEPCFEMGGDFYDYISAEASLGIMLGDAVGKGVPAAMLSTSVRSMVRAYVEDLYDLDEVIARVNTTMCRDTLPEEFVTLFYGWLDAKMRRLTYISAGHDPVYLYRDGQWMTLDQGGMPLGIMAEEEYEMGLVDLQSGDIVVIYSDGVPDAMNFEEKKFGRQRIMEEVESVMSHPAKAILNHLLWQIRRFIGMNKIYDDMTLVVVKVGELPEKNEESE